MSKAMLVMDMPTRCDVCEFARENRSNGLYCDNPLSMQYGKDISDYILCRADGCPLKPMPEKKDNAIGTNYQRFVNGYNACIDEIVKGSGENEVN